MHFNLPTPLHGWREFAADVGVIMLDALERWTANAPSGALLEIYPIA